jgi:hypothetical protein
MPLHLNLTQVSIREILPERLTLLFMATIRIVLWISPPSNWSALADQIILDNVHILVIIVLVRACQRLPIMLLVRDMDIMIIRTSSINMVSILFPMGGAKRRDMAYQQVVTCDDRIPFLYSAPFTRPSTHVPTCFLVCGKRISARSISVTLAIFAITMRYDPKDHKIERDEPSVFLILVCYPCRMPIQNRRIFWLQAVVWKRPSTHLVVISSRRPHHPSKLHPFFV